MTVKNTSITFRCDKVFKRKIELVSALIGKTPSEIIFENTNKFLNEFIENNPKYSEIFKEIG